MESMDWHAGRDPLEAAAELIPRVLRERAVFPLYQPIIDLATRTVVGVEALARGPAGSPVESPRALFAAATRAGMMPLIDQLCFTRAIEVARDATDVAPPLLFINAEPAALHHPITPDLLAAVKSQRPFRIVLEYTERAVATHTAALLEIAHMAHTDGNALAMDDVGADPLSLAFLPVVEPEVVKLDMHLLRNPHAPGTIEIAAIASGYAERTGAIVLAEGIETEDDLANAQALGARWGQGWLFGRPGPLTAIAGRPIDHHARLRPPRPDLHLPSGTPFSLAAVRHHSRAGDHRMVDGLTDYLLSVAMRTGSHTVVLGAYPDLTVGRAWLPRLASLTAAFVGIVGPALAGVEPRQVRLTAAPAPIPGGTETVLAVFGPHAAVALCVRPGHRGGVDFVLTHDPNLVHAVARMLMWRLDTVHRAMDPPIVDPEATPATVAS
jgi:EAL domain-containing protein (putative c-di-GMP-specific phosphodiesterase class I)